METLDQSLARPYRTYEQACRDTGRPVAPKLTQGRAVRSARQIHNLEVEGSNPSPATKTQIDE